MLQGVRRCYAIAVDEALAVIAGYCGNVMSTLFETAQSSSLSLSLRHESFVVAPACL
jgi:hypothetical protein